MTNGILEGRVKCSVAAVVRSPAHPGAFLAVRRPPDDDRLPDVWGLPAVTLTDGELPEDAVRRLGREKLGTELEARSFVGIRAADRGDYLLILMDIEAEVTGPAPDVHAARTPATAYVDQRWSESVEILREAAERGSVCARILVEAGG